MRAHLRQIVNTFIHVRQPRVLYSVVAPVLDNETGAFCPFPFAPPHLGDGTETFPANPTDSWKESYFEKELLRFGRE